MGILANWSIEATHFCTVSCVKLVTSRLRKIYLKDLYYRLHSIFLSRGVFDSAV